MIGLRPLAAVGAKVAAVRSGAARRLGDDFPDEVRPLAAEVDALIEAREAETARARARAADLAHGLKTPLQALIGEAGRLRAARRRAEADGIEEIAQAMRRHVDRELARARISPAGRPAATDPAAVIDRLMAVIRRTAPGRPARLAVDAAAGPARPHRRRRPDRGARRPARERRPPRERRGRRDRSPPRRGASASPSRTTAPASRRRGSTELTGRGARLDLAGPGAGLGLAIATEIAEAAGGTLSLANTGRGLRVTLTVPAVPRT